MNSLKMYFISKKIIKEMNPSIQFLEVKEIQRYILRSKFCFIKLMNVIEKLYSVKFSSKLKYELNTQIIINYFQVLRVDKLTINVNESNLIAANIQTNSINKNTFKKIEIIANFFVKQITKEAASESISQKTIFFMFLYIFCFLDHAMSVIKKQSILFNNETFVDGFLILNSCNITYINCLIEAKKNNFNEYVLEINKIINPFS